MLPYIKVLNEHWILHYKSQIDLSLYLFQVIYICLCALQWRSGIPTAVGVMLAGSRPPGVVQPDGLQRSKLFRPRHSYHAVHHGQLARAAVA